MAERFRAAKPASSDTIYMVFCFSDYFCFYKHGLVARRPINDTLPESISANFCDGHSSYRGEYGFCECTLYLLRLPLPDE